MSLTLKQLRYFIAAAETGQISHAAMEMNVSQSAVTASIQGLEADLGVRLLTRSAQGVSVTPEGARFLARAKGIMAAASDTIEQTAKDIRQVTVDVARMNTEALVDLDKLESAAAEYEEMDRELKEVMQNAERNARAVSTRLGALNDRMRVINDPHIPDTQYKGIPIEYIATLDDLGWTTGQPDYLGFNFNYVKPCFHKKWFLTSKITDGGSTQPNRHVAWKFVTWQLHMNSRRRQWRVSAN